jgi:selenocysteine lyase/cysteine desulfurase
VYYLINIEKARKDVPLLKKMVYLNHAGVSPCIRPVREAIEKHLKDWTWMNKDFMERIPFGGEG